MFIRRYYVTFTTTKRTCLYIFIYAKTYNLDIFQHLKRTYQYVFLAKQNVNYLRIFYIIKIFVSMHFYHFINKQFRFLDPLTYTQT